MIGDEPEPEPALSIVAKPWRTSRRESRLAYRSHRDRLADLPLVEGISNHKTEVSGGPQGFGLPVWWVLSTPVWLNRLERRGLSSAWNFKELAC
jgi:hypothetical protein